MGIEILILTLTFVATIFFVLLGQSIFSQGWKSYEERYVQGAEKTLDSMFITMPVQNINYLSVACFVLLFCIASFFTGQIFVGFVLGCFAFFIPQMTIKMMITKRHRLFGVQLVEALSTMGNALKAGLSLPQALEIVHKEMPNPIQQEFRLLCQELKFGILLEDALGHLQDRMKNDDLNLMSTSIIVAQEVGGNLSEIFDNISTTIRERHVIESRIKALTAQGKMQGVVLSAIPIVLGAFLTFMFPEMMSPLFSTTLGWVLIVICLGMISLGAFFIRKVVQINV